MRRNFRLGVAAAVCMLIPLVSQGIAMSQERSKLVDTGVIFSAQQVKRLVDMNPMIGITAPFWTPTPEEIAQLEGKLKPYLEGMTTAPAKAIVASLASYKRQYLGYTDGGKKWILVNSFCETYWRENDTWRDRVVYVLDGGPCFFQVRYDLSGSQFEQLEINGAA